VDEVQDVLFRRGYAWLDGATSSAIGTHLGRSGPSEMLAPRERATADPWSLSGAYGLGTFPWHTDGAIASNPPTSPGLQDRYLDPFEPDYDND
jgi:hypothetical protein